MANILGPKDFPDIESKSRIFWDIHWGTKKALKLSQKTDEETETQKIQRREDAFECFSIAKFIPPENRESFLTQKHSLDEFMLVPARQLPSRIAGMLREGKIYPDASLVALKHYIDVWYRVRNHKEDDNDQENISTLRERYHLSAALSDMELNRAIEDIQQTDRELQQSRYRIFAPLTLAINKEITELELEEFWKKYLAEHSNGKTHPLLKDRSLSPPEGAQERTFWGNIFSGAVPK